VDRRHHATVTVTRIRGLRDGDAEFVRDLVAAEGWNAGLRDVETFTAADRGAWFIADVGEEPVGVTLATRWNATCGWIGLYLVAAAWRGRGIGLTLFRAALARLEPGSIGLDGDASQRANYRRAGFVDVHGNTRWCGPAASWCDASPAPDVTMVSGTDVTVSDLVALDTRALGVSRSALASAWLAQPDAHSAAAVRDGHVVGFATARPARSGWKIGPLYAGDATMAAALAGAVTSSIPQDETCWLDVPDPNEEAQELCRERGLISAPTSGRMMRGPLPGADVSFTYGLLAHEVG
jgi:GNAT superfamily N-acetyltransferase